MFLIRPQRKHLEFPKVEILQATFLTVIKLEINFFKRPSHRKIIFERNSKLTLNNSWMKGDLQTKIPDFLKVVTKIYYQNPQDVFKTAMREHFIAINTLCP